METNTALSKEKLKVFIDALEHEDVLVASEDIASKSRMDQLNTLLIF